MKVNLVNQTGYEEILRKWVAGLGTGDLPDVAQLEDTATQQMIDTQSVVPVADCIKADDYDTSDIVERVLERYTVNGTLWPMPFNVSNPVLYYDKNAFRAAGLDPEKPPTTLDEVKADAQKIKDAGLPDRLRPQAQPVVPRAVGGEGRTPSTSNNQNGRSDRATAAVFDDATGRETFAWMKDMVDSGLARTNPDDGPNNFDNLLGIRSKVNGMTIDSSAALGQISQSCSRAARAAAWSSASVRCRDRSGTGGVLVGGGALYMSKKSSPEKIAATWEFVKFLVRGDTQATFAAGTGYVPIAKSATDEPVARRPVAEGARLQGRLRPDARGQGRHADRRPGHRRLRRCARGRARRGDEDAHRGHVVRRGAAAGAEGRHGQDPGLQRPRRAPDAPNWRAELVL